MIEKFMENYRECREMDMTIFMSILESLPLWFYAIIGGIIGFLIPFLI